MISATCNRCLTGLLLLALCGARPLRAEWVVDFEDVSPARAYGGPGAGYFENGKNLTGSFASGGATLNNQYTYFAAWDADVWSGWSYSNTTDTVTSSYTNQYSAYVQPSSGDRNNYAVAYHSVFDPVPAIDLPAAPVGAHFANTTYAALSMLHGNSPAKQFGGASGTDPDWYVITFTGKDAQGNVTNSFDYFLADYQSANSNDDYVLDDWTWVDLTPLGSDTRRIEFTLSSSDNDIDFGMNTPAYFVMDNLTVVPEPGSAVLAVLGATVLLWVFHRRLAKR